MFCTTCGSSQFNIATFCTNCGRKLSKQKAEKSKKKNSHAFIWFALIFLAIVALLAWLFYEEPMSGSQLEDNIPVQPVEKSSNSYSQNDIASSVVNIFCSSAVSDDLSGGGSGTLISDDGLVLTNSHIIPQDETNILTVEEGCVVILPDPVTGQPEEMFWAEPIVLSSVSDEYDIAFLKIYSAYLDDETNEYAGTYPREFPAFEHNDACESKPVRLGESVRIFGYPTLSGGISLTITDGVVSSFPGDGLIVTSAKISSGNSGGLAVDQDGCLIGIPSMVSVDENESLGMIISVDLIAEFVQKMQEELDSIPE